MTLLVGFENGVMEVIESHPEVTYVHEIPAGIISHRSNSIFQKASKRKDDIAEAQMNVDDSPIRLITVLSDSERDVIIVITEEVSDTS